RAALALSAPAASTPTNPATWEEYRSKVTVRLEGNLKFYYQDDLNTEWTDKIAEHLTDQFIKEKTDGGIISSAKELNKKILEFCLQIRNPTGSIFKNSTYKKYFAAPFEWLLAMAGGAGASLLAAHF